MQGPSIRLLPAEERMILRERMGVEFGVIAWVMTGLYLLYAVAHWYVLPREVALPLSILAGSSAGAFAVIGLAPLRVKQKPAVGVAVVVIAAINSTVQMVLTADPFQSTNHLLLVVAAGAFVLVPTAGFFAVTLTLGMWAVGAWLTGSVPIVHFAFAFLAATTVALLLNHQRRSAMFHEREQRLTADHQISFLLSETERAQLLLAGYPLGILIVSDGFVRTHNQAAARLLGWGRTSIVGRSIAEAFGESIMHAIHEVLVRGDPAATPMASRSGVERGLYLQRVRSIHGPLVFVTVTHDATVAQSLLGSQFALPSAEEDQSLVLRLGRMRDMTDPDALLADLEIVRERLARHRWEAAMLAADAVRQALRDRRPRDEVQERIDELRLATMMAETMARTDASESSRERLDVLLVDDDPIVATLVGPVLADMGHSWERVDSVEEAVERIRENHVRCVMTEIALRGQDGYALLRWLAGRGRQRHGEPPVRRPSTIVISSRTSRREAETMRRLGVRQVIPKPLDLGEVQDAITSAMEARHGGG